VSSRPAPLLELTDAIARFGTSVLVLVGADDHLYTSSQLDQISHRLRTAGGHHEMIVCPDTPHGFFCHEHDHCRSAAAEDAFTRLTDLLDIAMPTRGSADSVQVGQQ
jgi:carboxymethylenebutenolidase